MASSSARKLPFKGKQMRKSFPAAFRSLVDEWIVLRTIDDGNCGPDAISKALQYAPAEPNRGIGDIRAILA